MFAEEETRETVIQEMLRKEMEQLRQHTEMDHEQAERGQGNLAPLELSEQMQRGGIDVE